MRTFKEKCEHLKSTKFIINEKLERLNSNYRIGFTFKSDGTKIIYKVDLDGKILSNMGNFEKFSCMAKYLLGFYNGLTFL